MLTWLTFYLLTLCDIFSRRNTFLFTSHHMYARMLQVEVKRMPIFMPILIIQFFLVTTEVESATVFFSKVSHQLFWYIHKTPIFIFCWKLKAEREHIRFNIRENIGIVSKKLLPNIGMSKNYPKYRNVRIKIVNKKNSHWKWPSQKFNSAKISTRKN